MCPPTHLAPPREYPDPSRTSLRVPRTVSHLSERVPQPFLDLPEGPRTIWDLWQLPPTRLRPLRGSPNSRTCPRFHRPILDLPKGPPTRPRPPRGSRYPSRIFSRVPRPVQTSPRVPRPVPAIPDQSRTSPRLPQLIQGLPEGPPIRPLLLECPPTHLGPTQGYPKPSRTYPRVLRRVPDLPKGPPTPPGTPLGSSDPSRNSPRVP